MSDNTGAQGASAFAQVAGIYRQQENDKLRAAQQAEALRSQETRAYAHEAAIDARSKAHDEVMADKQNKLYEHQFKLEDQRARDLVDRDELKTVLKTREEDATLDETAKSAAVRAYGLMKALDPKSPTYKTDVNNIQEEAALPFKDMLANPNKDTMLMGLKGLNRLNSYHAKMAESLRANDTSSDTAAPSTAAPSTGFNKQMFMGGFKPAPELANSKDIMRRQKSEGKLSPEEEKSQRGIMHAIKDERSTGLGSKQSLLRHPVTAMKAAGKMFSGFASDLSKYLQDSDTANAANAEAAGTNPAYITPDPNANEED